VFAGKANATAKSSRLILDALHRAGKRRGRSSVIYRELSLQAVGETLGWRHKKAAYAAGAERLKNALEALCRLSGMGNARQ
jgi:hypothetical protein